MRSKYDGAITEFPWQHIQSKLGTWYRTIVYFDLRGSFAHILYSSVQLSWYFIVQYSSSLHLQLLKPWKLLGTEYLAYGGWPQAIVYFDWGGSFSLSLYYTVHSNHSNEHTLLYPAYFPTLPIRRKKCFFSQT